MLESTANETPKIIVFCGPPCSGKSELAQAFAARLAAPHLSVDDIRRWILPESGQTSQARRKAYQTMHGLADSLLGAGISVVLDATYNPIERRKDVEYLALKYFAPLFVLQCTVEPDEAVRRFRTRPEGHPAEDLTEQRVHYLAEAGNYSYVPNLPLLDTKLPSDLTREERTVNLIRAADDAIALGPVQPGGWSRGFKINPATDTHRIAEKGDKLSPLGLRWAVWKLRLLFFGFALVLGFAMLGILPVLDRWVDSAAKPFGLATWTEVLAWGRFWVSIAVLAGGILPVIKFFEPSIEKAWKVLRAGNAPRYEPCEDERPSDKSLFEEYYTRSDPANGGHRDGFRIKDVPVYFVIPPRPTITFDVFLTEKTPRIEDKIPTEAACEGLDWVGFRRWRYSQLKAEYYNFIDEDGICVSRLDREAADPVIDIMPCRFSEYAYRELSVNLNAGERLCDMRALFEGPRWHQHAVDLDNFAYAKERYSLFCGVCMLVITSDGYLILQRRSRSVSQGAGGLGASVTGFCDWKDFEQNRNWRVSLKHSALREMREELGVSEYQLVDTRRPFFAAGFNLLHGRDLNFYGCWRAKIDAAKVGQLHREEARDRWEVASLVFVPVTAISQDGTLTGGFANIYQQCNRHLKALLYAFARVKPDYGTGANSGSTTL